jgi:predicted small lipoprotein YifL
MKKQFRIPTAILLAMFLFGCGQSGPLYVSGNPSTIQPPTEEASAENEEESDAEDSESE